VKLEFVLNLNLLNLQHYLNLKSSILLQVENARVAMILVDEAATIANEMVAAAVDTVVAAAAEETRVAAVDTVAVAAVAEETQVAAAVDTVAVAAAVEETQAAAVDTVAAAAVAVAEETQMAVAVAAAVAAVDIAVNREVRISNQARIQAKVTKVAKNHNRVAAMAVKKAVTVMAAVTEIEFILLPEFDFLLG
jgi:hypothetical protein